MRTNHQLRLYANPIRLLLLLLVCGALMVIGVWMVGGSSDMLFAAVIGWGFIGVSAFGIAHTLPQLVWTGLLRHPMLQIDEQGWSSSSWLFLGKRSAGWQEIASIGLRRMPLGPYPSHIPRGYSSLLVVNVKDPATTARGGSNPIPSGSPSEFGDARIVVHLNALFLPRTPPDKVEGVLRQILTTFASEVALYGIQAVTAM